MTKVREIQVCGGRLCANLYDACKDYIECVDTGIDREKLNFAIEFPDGTVKHLTIREMGDGIVAYGDFEGMPDALEWAQELLNTEDK